MYLNVYSIWFTGDVEIITNIGPNDRLFLETHMTPNIQTMLELVYSAGDSTATVRTTRPLDAEEIKMVCSSLTDPVFKDR